MDDKTGFKINLRAGDNDDLNATKVIEQPLNRSDSKISTLLIVLVFLVLSGMVAFLYYDLNSRIQTINNRGSAGIENLENEFNEKFTEFSEQFSSQQETMRVLQSDLDSKLKKLNSSVTAIQTDKLDKKDLGAAVKKIQADLAPLQESITHFNEQLIGFNEKTKKITAQVQKVQTGVLNNKKEISTLDAIHIDRVSFEQELKKEREFNQQNMAHASEALFSEIATLHQLIKNLEQKLEQTSMSSPGKSTTKSSSEKTYPPKPGEIIEQEIQ